MTSMSVGGYGSQKTFITGLSNGDKMAALRHATPPRTEFQLHPLRGFSNQRKASSNRNRNRTALQLQLRNVSSLCLASRTFVYRVNQKPPSPGCLSESISTQLSTKFSYQLGCERLAARGQRIFGGRCSEAELCTSGRNVSYASCRRIATAGFKDKFKKGLRKTRGRRTRLEEQLQIGFKKVGLERQFGELPQWSAYVPIVAGGLEILIIVGWNVYLKGDLRGSSMFNFSGEGLLTLLLGTNFAVGWLASQMSTWRVQALSPSLLPRKKEAASPNILDFILSGLVNLIPYGNFLAWTRSAWKEGNSVSSLNALVYVVPMLVKLVLWGQGLTIGRVTLLAWILGSIHRPYDSARVQNEKLLATIEAKIENARKAKEEKEYREKGAELTVDEMVLLQQRKELEEFDVLLARSVNGTISIPGPTKDWSVGDTLQWLAQEGFARYASTFAENDVDGAILLLLTEDDLRDELGIQSLGDSKKLSQAIQRLK